MRGSGTRPYFLLQDGEEGNIVENPAAQVQGGAGIQVAWFLADNNANALITVRCGQNVADVFTATNIKIYKSVHKTAADELTAFSDGKPEELTQFHCGFHGTHGS